MAKDDHALLSGVLNELLQFEFTKIYFAERSRSPAELNFYSERQPYYRFTLPLAGRFYQRIAIDGVYREVCLYPGEAVVFHPFCTNYYTPDYFAAIRRSLAVVLRPGYLRLAYSRPYVDEIRPRVDFHLYDSLRSSTINAVIALGALTNRPEDRDCALALIKPTLRLIARDLAASRGERNGKALNTWHEVADYTLEHCLDDLTREEVARRFQLSDGYVSKLFRRHAGDTFCNYLTRLRLEKAAELLRDSALTVGEIAADCGFHSSSYFIRQFRHCYSVSPGEYRFSHHLNRRRA